MSNKANFRAYRESVGISQGDLAKALNVTVLTVKNWEKRSYPKDPPGFAFEYISSLISEQEKFVKKKLEVAKIKNERVVKVDYFRDQLHYDKFGDGGSFSVANAKARALGAALEVEGYEVEYSYPEETNYLYFSKF